MLKDPYQKGARKERKVVNNARDKGHIAFRSAGSHSPIDVCIIEQDTRSIRFVQCKPDSMSELAKNRLRQELNFLSGSFNVSFHVI